MRAGFNINKRRGNRCRAISRCSRVKDGSGNTTWVGVKPRCVIRNIYKE